MAEKTNAIRMLDSKKIPHTIHTYDSSEAMSGTEVATILNQDPAKVFKTLVTVGKSGTHYVFIIPSHDELDLKKAAKHVGEKSVEMIKSKDLLPLTGYIHGGCSPIGMKKFFRTTLHISAQKQETICISGGRLGLQIEITPDNLTKAIPFTNADMVI